MLVRHYECRVDRVTRILFRLDEETRECAEVPQDSVITVAMRPSGLPVQKTNESTAAGMASRPLRTRAQRFQSVR